MDAVRSSQISERQFRVTGTSHLSSRCPVTYEGDFLWLSVRIVEQH